MLKLDFSFVVSTFLCTFVLDKLRDVFSVLTCLRCETWASFFLCNFQMLKSKISFVVCRKMTTFAVGIRRRQDWTGSRQDCGIYVLKKYYMYKLLIKVLKV